MEKTRRENENYKERDSFKKAKLKRKKSKHNKK